MRIGRGSLSGMVLEGGRFVDLLVWCVGEDGTLLFIRWRHLCIHTYRRPRLACTIYRDLLPERKIKRTRADALTQWFVPFFSCWEYSIIDSIGMARKCGE